MGALALSAEKLLEDTKVRAFVKNRTLENLNPHHQQVFREAACQVAATGGSQARCASVLAWQGAQHGDLSEVGRLLLVTASISRNAPNTCIHQIPKLSPSLFASLTLSLPPPSLYPLTLALSLALSLSCRPKPINDPYCTPPRSELHGRAPALAERG